ncbi:MarC family protein [Bizionia saleffrena]|uniref:MarC family protein n=1 Tax=Bizionia saleffrena TaxID=291189 RepID=UPI002938E776|nr:MarC family protein [Bizionia saleffrena]
MIVILLLTDNHLYSVQQQATTAVLVPVVIVITLFLLLAANSVPQKIGEYGITVISKVMGLILSAYAIQSILVGIKDFVVVLH